MKEPANESNFFLLLGSLLTILFSSAVVHQIPGTWGQNLFSLVLILALVGGIWSLHASRRWQLFLLGTVGLVAGLAVVSRFSAWLVFDYLSLLLMVLLFLGMLRLTAGRVLFHGRVDANRLAGALSLYLLLGLVWTLMYLVLLTFDPQALEGLVFENWRHAFSDTAYFSFVTLTTLGYGDILPRDPLARFLAYLEAVTGVFYLAIVVASLVSIAIQEARNEHRD